MEVNSDKNNNKDTIMAIINENENNHNNNNNKNAVDDDDDEKLPKVLEKLEIVPILPIIKIEDNKLPLLLNPFYFQGNNCQIKDDGNDLIATNYMKNLFGRTKCNCNIRKQQQQQQQNRMEHSIINQTRFKRNKNNQSKRVFLKESLLKTVQNCCKIHNITTSQPASSSSSSSDQILKGSIIEFLDYPTLEDLRLEDDCINSTRTSSSSSIKIEELKRNELNDEIKKLNTINYRIFIKDFDLLSSYCNLSKQSSSSSLRNFTTLQSSDNRLIRNPTRTISSNTNVSKYNQQNNNNNNNSNNNTNNYIINSTQLPSTSSSSSSSCSQQARNDHNSSATATSSCDITIDELACYFETFVHIPKKMSSMAEMMYI